MSRQLKTRRCSRLIILSPSQRLLLFNYQDEHSGSFWSTAGGELQDGETYEEAAKRELFEEIGAKHPIGPFLLEREDIFAVARSTPARWIERYFLVTLTTELTPTSENWTEEELETIQNFRWWSLEELKSTEQMLLPSCIPDLMELAMRRS